jgi:Flp pilus assembly protein TadD
LAPTDAQLWYNLGITQQQASQFPQAVETLQHTVEIKPNYIRARSALGDLLVQLGRVEEGRQQYRFILEKLSPTDALVQEKLNALDQTGVSETPALP